MNTSKKNRTQTSKNKGREKFSFAHLIKGIDAQKEILSTLSQFPPEWRPTIIKAFISRPRKNQRRLSQQEKDDFNSAINSAIEDGTYQNMAEIHHDFMGEIHSFGAPSMKFLPWHRVYLARLEAELNHYSPGLRIPYWNWAVDHEIPSWLILPTGVTRSPGLPDSLPTQQDININVMSIGGTFEEFSLELERWHGSVHNWAGGTMGQVHTSPNDPLFFLHHSNVDRIWANWQKSFPNDLPPLEDDDAIMEPWSDTIQKANKTINYHYYYQPPELGFVSNFPG